MARRTRTPAWEAFEELVADRLHLSRTIASGSQWHDPSDGVDRSHYSENPFSLMNDSKHTVGKTFSLNRAFLRTWGDRAAELGKRFILTVQFADSDPRGTQHEEYVLTSLDDFAELYEAARAYWANTATNKEISDVD